MLWVPSGESGCSCYGMSTDVCCLDLCLCPGLGYWPNSKKQVLDFWIVVPWVCKQRDSRAASPAVPPTESWMAPHHHLSLCVMRVALLQNISAFQGSLPHALVLLPPHHCPAHLKGGRHQSEPRRQVSYLHRAAQAQPIFQEDGNRNVTNPSVPVWICMLIWSNRPSGDSAREQFNHAIYDSCFPASSVIGECTHAPPGLDLINWLCRRGNVECRPHA